MDAKQKILVTGASGGFGKLTVMRLLERGHKVAAAMREVRGRNIEAARELAGHGASVVEMDVCDGGSVDSGVAGAIEELGGLDAVVNNAGQGVLGVQESFTPEDWQRIFDVNVFGVQRVIRAVLPHMRGRHSGLLVQISSLLGRIAVPFYGPYIASKWALEAMSENYRVELSRFGVDVVVVEPGGYQTAFIGNLMLPSDRGRDESLAGMPREAQDFLHGFAQALAANPAQAPENVADAIASIIETKPGHRPFRTVVDKMGMGDAIQPYNEQFEKISSDLYAAFGLGHFRLLHTNG